MGYDYEVTFHGAYPAPFGEWPQLEVPPVHFGSQLGSYSDCPLWETLDGTPVANVSAAVTALEAPGECSAGRRDLQTVLALAYSPLGGSFSVSLAGSAPAVIPLSATAREFQDLMNAALATSAANGDSASVVVTDRQTHRHHETGRFGVAWFVEVEPSAASKLAGGPADRLVVSDAYTTGQDAAVDVFETVTITTTSQRDDLRGSFRLYLGAEVTEVLAYDATPAKITEALERLDSVASVEVLRGDVGFGVPVRLPNVRLTNASAHASAAGDWTRTVAPGDELDFSAAKDKALAAFGYFGFYSERLYGVTEASYESGGALITSLTYNNASKTTNFLLDQKFFGNASVVADASVGSSELSLRPVQGLVKLEVPPQVKFTWPSLEGRRTWLELCDGCVASYGVAVNQTITVERETYVVFGIGIDGLPSCGDDCLLLDRPFKGTEVNHASPYVAAFPYTMSANTTTDLSTANAGGDAIAVGDRLFVATSTGELDELTVEAVGNHRLTLSGNFTERYVGAGMRASANGLRRRLVFRATSADLDTFQLIPESDWRGA